MARYLIWVLALLLAAATSARAEPPLPADDGRIHNGVASCASDACHGAVAPDESQPGILRNEFVIWARRDAHSGAYRALLGDASRDMARKLGIGEPQTEKVCLDCHASNIPEARRGKSFRLEDGIGCESCHGGSEGWLSSHTLKGTNHRDNLAAGLFPTDDAAQRARLCLSCHEGTPERPMTHRILGAGHPRLGFELETFGALQPPHYRQDEDYLSRKAGVSGMQAWTMGQAVAAGLYLDRLVAAAGSPQAGGMPELALYDCHACHHPMSQIAWSPRPGVGLGPGVPRLNDAHLVVLRTIVRPLDPAVGARMLDLTRALHEASQRGPAATEKAARKLRPVVARAEEALRAHRFTDREVEAILESLVAEGQAGEYHDYAVAEQVAMGVVTLVNAREANHPDAADLKQHLNDAVDALYALMAHEDDFRRDEVPGALQEIQRLSRQLSSPPPRR